MNRILMAGAAVLVLMAAMISPVVADEGVPGKMTPVADEIPAPGALKTNAGVAEGHKTPTEVYKKAVAAAKAGEMDKLKTCFNPNNLDYIDEESWESEGENKLTYLGAMAATLKGYADAGEERAQGAVGDYAVIAVKNGEAVNLVKVVRVAKWTEKGEEKDKNWYLSSYYASEYRVDYAAPGVKAIREAIEKGDVEKLKEYLDPWQTQVLDLIAGVQEGVDPYALLLKRLQMLGDMGKGETKIQPTVVLDRSGTRLAYWFHKDKTDAAAASDTFIVLQFWEDWDWQADKKFTNVKIDVASTTEFHKNGAEAFKNWVQDWSW